MTSALVSFPFVPWNVTYILLKKNPFHVKARCKASTSAHDLCQKTPARLHKRHRKTWKCESERKKRLIPTPHPPKKKQTALSRVRKIKIVPVDDIYKKRETNNTLTHASEYLSAFFFYIPNKVKNLSQHFHYVIRKVSYKIWPCSIQIIQCKYANNFHNNGTKNEENIMKHGTCTIYIYCNLCILSKSFVNVSFVFYELKDCRYWIQRVKSFFFFLMCVCVFECVCVHS